MGSILEASCPVPNMDFDVITLGHGSGGILTNKLLDQGVFELFDNEELNKRHDGALFTPAPGKKLAFSTDSFVISPIFFPGGNIGSLSVHGTTNDVAMCGAIPRYISLSFILEEGLKMEEFWQILWSVKQAAEEAGVLIITGDTKVVERGKGDKVFINTTGIGEVHDKADFGVDKIKAGDKIIVNGHIATHGIAIMSVREGLEFETTIQSDSCAFGRTVVKLLDEYGQHIRIMRDPTRGGVATVLNELARESRLGIEINEKDLPVLPQVNAACEMLGLDPLYVANEGLFVSIIDGDIANEYLRSLQSYEHGRYAAIIGEVVDDHAGQVLQRSPIGGLRVVNMLTGEQLPRIC